MIMIARLESLLHFAATTDVLRILLDSSLKVALLLAAAGLTTLFLRRSGAAMRHLVWSVALGAGLLLPFLSATLPSWELDFVPRLGLAPSRSEIHSVVGAATPPELSKSMAPVASESQLLPAPPSGASSMQVPAGQTPVGSTSARVMAWMARFGWIASWPVLLLLAWFVGALAVLFRLGLGMAAIRIMCRSADLETSEPSRRFVQVLAREVGLRRSVTLRLARGPAMPMTWGFFRPTILLPADAVAWTVERSRAVLLHELAHVRRHDYVVQLGAQIACAIYWFNPLVWIAAAQLRLERERACDDQVLRSGLKASEYATQLLEMARSLRPVGARLAPTVAMAQPSQLSVRLLAILDDKRRRTALTRKLAILTWFSVLGISIPLAAIGPKVVRPKESRPVSKAGSSTASDPESVRTSTSTSSSTSSSTSKSTSTTRSTSAAGAPASAPVTTAGPTHASAEATHGITTSDGSTTSTHIHESSSSKGKTAASIIEDDGRLKITVHGSGVDLAVEAQGKVEFNDDQTDIATISRGGSFELTDKSGDSDRRIEIRSQAGGELERKYWEDGDSKAYDAAAQQWFAEALLTIFRRTGYAAKERASRILERDGVDGLLKELSEIQGDYSRGKYYDVLLQSDLDAATLQRVVKQAGAEIESDYELAELLIRASKGRRLDDATRAAYVQATTTLESDYEHHRALSAMLEQGAASPAVMQALLESATSIQSDYEAAELLIEVMAVQPANEPLGPEVLRVADNLQSDYEHHRVLAALLERRDLGTPVLLSVLKSAPRIGSEYERAELLVQLANQHEIDADLRQPFLDAARTLRSDYERGRVLSAASEHGL